MVRLAMLSPRLCEGSADAKRTWTTSINRKTSRLEANRVQCKSSNYYTGSLVFRVLKVHILHDPLLMLPLTASRSTCHTMVARDMAPLQVVAGLQVCRSQYPCDGYAVLLLCRECSCRSIDSWTRSNFKQPERLFLRC